MFRITKLFSPLLAGGMGMLLLAGCHDHKQMDPHKRADKIVERMQKGLDLTPDQTAQVKQVAYEIADTMQAQMRTHMQDQNGEFLMQLRAPAVDTAALSHELQARESEMQMHMQEHQAFMIAKFVQLHDILTPDQREKLAAFLEKHKDMMMRENGDHPGE
jgi:Spy/CpxP family protein refolding chaperone